MNKELISVIVPVYNVEKYLRECLDSVLRQSYSNLEIILVNDGSTDLSREICYEYARRDQRICVVDKENEGLSVARETGISLAKGIYFATVDSDDVLHEEYIAKMHKQIVENSADICVCARMDFDDKGQMAYYLEQRIEACKQITEENLVEEYATFSRDYQMSDSWNKLYRREFVKSADVHFCLDKQYNGTDFLFNHMLLLHCPKIVVVNEALYCYRIVPNSRVRKKNKPLQKGFHIIIGKLLQEVEKCKLDSKIKRQISAIYVSMIKYVTLDIVMECNSWTNMSGRIKECVADCHQFMDENGLKENISKIVPKHLKVFYFLLKNRFSKGISLYYVIRNMIRR